MNRIDNLRNLHLFIRTKNNGIMNMLDVIILKFADFSKYGKYILGEPGKTSHF